MLAGDLQPVDVVLRAHLDPDAVLGRFPRFEFVDDRLKRLRASRGEVAQMGFVIVWVRS